AVGTLLVGFGDFREHADPGQVIGRGLVDLGLELGNEDEFATVFEGGLNLASASLAPDFNRSHDAGQNDIDTGGNGWIQLFVVAHDFSFPSDSTSFASSSPLSSPPSLGTSM